MKTALVTTIWLDNEEYQKKIIKFLGYYLTECLDLKFDHLYIIDNGSDPREINKVDALVTGEPVSFIRYMEHYDRPSHLDYKYLWRAVYTFKDIFKEGYDKIIYMDSDFYALSSKMVNHINDIDSGWHTFWCKKHGFPETGCYVLTRDCENYKNFVNMSYVDFIQSNNNNVMEQRLPVTSIEKSFIGDRWSEYGKSEIPEKSDFSAQTVIEMKVKYG